ncbi:hypothetical protein sos41_26370 [Alphaproteobacteria bacterium SO-S41]|nr:hypothetical protein sos41_26370 [Alphaproteobacteria bacterium SO-S41]
MRLMSTVACAVLLAAAAFAADSQTFDVKGKGPNGDAYTGKVTLTEVKPGGTVASDVIDVVWDFNGSKTQGVGLVDPNNKKNLIVSYIMEGVPGLAIMTEQDNKASGVWYVQGAPGTGTEEWTPVAGTDAAPAAPAEAGAITYERAITCAAVTSYVTGMLRSTPGADAAKIDAYDKANSAWTMKLSDVGADKTMDQRIDDIRAKQGEWANDPDGMAKATPVADDCVATAPPME